MADLITHTNIPGPDDFYEHLIRAHDDLSEDQSHAMNAALVLLLANHIGDMDVIDQALERARHTVLHSTT